MEEAKTALEGKETEIKNLKDGLRWAKEVAVREYRDSDSLLSRTPSVRSRRPILTWMFQISK